MSNVPSDLYYTQSHEWVSIEDGIATIGITEHAQELLGDMVFIELPDVGAILHTGEEASVVESVKAASDVYSPVSGEVTEVNEALVDNPGVVNNDSFNDGWLFKIKLDDVDSVDDLLDADAYRDIIETDEH
ncbi:MAG: glycine cleavage system protein GcvH [Gammaproteobacteria bacterium]|nr:glycine cleavage system protein GcvH [Gammaproteobacteria bacterium]